VAQKLDVIFAGAGEFGLPTLHALMEKHRVVRVYSQLDKPAGRGNRMTPTPVAKFALEQGLEVVRTGDINSEALPVADVMVVIAFGQKIAPAAVNHPQLGSINLHASVLPRLRGAAPINWAILRGDAYSGNSIIRLAPRMDAGAILAQSRVEIGELETAGELHDRLAENGAGLVIGTLEQLSDGTAVEREQDESLATIAPKLNREAAKLDFSRPAGELALAVRGMYPWPGCRVRVVSPENVELAKLTFVRARPLRPSSILHPPSSILDSGAIACGQGTQLEIVELQPESKRPMTMAAYRNGHPWPAGGRIEAI
jgi:methionyl-tRNA formyltransferase